MVFWDKSKRFCDLGPTCYKISTQKEIFRRKLADSRSDEKFPNRQVDTALPNLIVSHGSHMIKRGPGIEPELQINKAVNIRLASATMNGLVFHPGESFSFWHYVGNTTRRRGYMDGRILVANQLRPGVGGGLCNLANTIHWMVLHSPLDVTEFHSHSDALAPDEGPRRPFATGTSVSYNYIDYRFKNNTDQDIQLMLWTEGDDLYGEIRSEHDIPWAYELVEEGHCFRQEGEKFFRVSKIYRETRDKESGELVDRKLVLNNHSEVMFDYDLIPQDQIAR